MGDHLISGIVERGRAITWLLVLVLFIAASALALSSGDQLRFPDERDYHRLALSINAGEGYVNAAGEPTAYRAPGYPAFLSLLYRLWPSPVAATLANALAYAATALLLAQLVCRRVPGGGFFAPLLVLLYPIGLYTASTLYPQTVGALLLVAVVALLSRCSERLVVTGGAGLLLGLLVLTIPSFLLLAPVFAAIVAVAHRTRLVEAVGHVALLLSGVILIVAPWTIRNAVVFDAFVPVSTNSGENLLLGNSENARPNSGVNVDLTPYLDQLTAEDEAARDAQLRGFALDWIVENPGDAATLYGKKVLNYFNFRNELATQSEGSSLRDLISLLTYYPLLLLALIRLSLVRRFPLSFSEGVLFVVYIGHALLSAIFFTRIRFRVPFDMLLIGISAILLGLLLAEWTARFEKRRSSITVDAPS